MWEENLISKNSRNIIQMNFLDADRNIDRAF